MPIKIRLGAEAEQVEQKEPQATIALNIVKTLDGNLLIKDHAYIDILISPKENLIVSMPKTNVEKETYEYQRDLARYLFEKGIAIGPPQGTANFGMMESSYPPSADVNPVQAALYQIDRYITKSDQDTAVAREYDQNIEDRFTDPTDKDSTKYGEIPPYQDTPAGAADSYVPYIYAGMGYYY